MANNRKPLDLVQMLGLLTAGLMIVYALTHMQAQPSNANKQQVPTTTAAAPKAEPPAEQVKPTAEKTETAEVIPPSAVETELSAKLGTVEPPDVTEPPMPKPLAEKPTSNASVAKQPELVLTNRRFRLVFSHYGASLKSAQLIDEHPTAADKRAVQIGATSRGLELLDEIEPNRRSLTLVRFIFGGDIYEDLAGLPWNLTEEKKTDEELTLSFSTQNKDFRLTQRYRLALKGEGDRHLTMSISVENKTAEPKSFTYVLRGPAGILLDGPPKDPKQGAYVNIRAAMAGRGRGDANTTVSFYNAPENMNANEDKHKLTMAENVWVGLKNRFFLTLLIPSDPASILKFTMVPLERGVRLDKRDDDRYAKEHNAAVLAYRMDSTPVEPGATSVADEYKLFMGPASSELLAAYEAEVLKPAHALNLDTAIQYFDLGNWHWPRVDWLSRKLTALFSALHGWFGSWVIAIILLTLCVKVALHPLQRKMMVSMNKMQKLSPLLKAIEKKYEGQTAPEIRKKMEVEKWDLMRKSGANPATGCLPMFVQMPIFFALYGAFSRAFDLRQAGSLWIEDLSLPDRLISPLGFWPHELNVLPLAYVVLSLLQSLTQPKSPDPQQEQQRKMMTYMPVIFGFLFYRMPAGLVMYFTASSVFAILETWLIKKYVIKDAKAPLATPVVPGLKPPPPVTFKAR
jgi:YidC/Oxa1 family membrane protein insertase